MALLALLGALAFAAIAQAKPSGQGRWTAAWGVAQFRPGPLAKVLPQPAFDDAGGLSVRNVVRTSVAGASVRVRFSNLFGTRPLSLDRVRVALSAGGAAIAPGSSRTVRFGGRTQVTIPVGAQTRSDAVPLRVAARRSLAISVYSSRPTGRVTIGGDLLRTTYVSQPGDHTAATTGGAFDRQAKLWYFLSGLDVLAPASVPGVVVALGDSITAGTGSTSETWRAWPDRLAERFARAQHPLAVVDAGISGNTLHESSPCYGQKGPDRLGRDVFGQTRVRAMILALGVNDLVQPAGLHAGPLGSCNAKTRVTAPAMIRLYKRIAARAHAHGLRIIAATITPFAGYLAPTPVPELDAERRAIDRWIRRTHAFDGVADFAKALQDPTEPSRLAPRYDSGDHLHPNDAGHLALAGRVPLSLLYAGSAVRTNTSTTAASAAP